MSRDQLVATMRRVIEHSKAGTQDQAPSIMRVPTSNYADPARWALEVDRIFKRLPLNVGFSVELPNPGDYKALEIAGVPLLLTRGPDGALRAFVNMCSHRGAQLVEPGSGNTRRFACPYHAWTYDTVGSLVGVLDRADFGELDTSCLGLTPLPVGERAGMIFASLTPGHGLDLDTFLCGYDELLVHLDFEHCTYIGNQTVVGPNWKLAYDGYLDFYHLPILHRATFGTEIGNKALYDAWGPHQRVSMPSPKALKMAETPESEWSISQMTAGVWTVFPHVSIATFEAGGGAVYMVSQLFPGADVTSSVTVQNFLYRGTPTDEQREAALAQKDFLRYVVTEEDYKTGLGIGKAIGTGAKSEFLFGRNEGGAQRFHGWVQTMVDTPDQELVSAFSSTAR